MVELSVLGIFPRQPGDTPEVFLFAHDTDCIISFHTPRSESMALCALLHCADDSASAAGKPSAAARHGSVSVEFHSDDIPGICAALGGRVSKVVLVGMDSGGCEAEARLDTIHGPLFLTCGPAEGLVLAVRYAIPVYGTPELMEQAEQISGVLDSLAPEARMILMWKLATLRAYPASRVHGLWYERLKEQAQTLRGHDVGKAERKTRRAIFHLLAKHRAEVGDVVHEEPEPIPHHKRPAQVSKPILNQQEVDELLALLQMAAEEELEFDDDDESLDLENDVALLSATDGDDQEGSADTSEAKDSGTEAASEDDRWTDLLLRLSPETKVLM